METETGWRRDETGTYTVARGPVDSMMSGFSALMLDFGAECLFSTVGLGVCLGGIESRWVGSCDQYSSNYVYLEGGRAARRNSSARWLTLAESPKGQDCRASVGWCKY